MFLSGDIGSTVLEVILSFPYFLDIIIFLFLLISTSIGYAKGFWRGTFRMLFVVLLLVLAWYFLVDTFAKYVSETLLSQLGVTFKVGEYNATSINELITYSIKYASESGKEIAPKYLDEAYLNSFAYAICKSLAWLFIVIIVQFVSWIISGILYFLIIRLIIPEKIRKVKLRLLGALMGLIQSVLVTFAFMISFSSLSPFFKQIKTPGEGVFSWCSPVMRLIMGSLDPNNSMLAPYVGGLEDNMSGQQFSFEVEGYEETFKLNEELNEFINTINEIITELPPEESDDNSPSTSDVENSSDLSGSSEEENSISIDVNESNSTSEELLIVE